MLSITDLAAILSAIGVICASVAALYNMVKKVDKKFESYDKMLTENTRYILKLALLSDDLPITDRINAGKRYLELGGNGYGKVVYNRLIHEIEEGRKE